MVKSIENGTSLPPFLVKCYQMVDDDSNNELISWSESSDSFIIWDDSKFSSQLLSKYFKHNNFSSFVRQLNIYLFPWENLPILKWLQEENCKGAYKYWPPNNELIVALKSHDLYVYSGHGDGLNIDLEEKIQELNGCAATVLLGCKSGELRLNGLYAPEGAPILYLSVGSPNIVASLWSVCGDVDEFGMALCAGWFQEIANDLTCAICDAIKYEPGSQCNHRRRTGSFMRRAREACQFPFFTGASLVLYGVPTSLKR